MLIKVIDVETTGLEATDEVVECASVDYPFHPGAETQHHPCHHWSQLVKPTKPIPPEVAAVHHITDVMVIDAVAWDVAQTNIIHGGSAEADYYAAHKADFDGMFVTDDIRKGKSLLCTYKAALRIWPDAPGFSNQILRYWLKLAIVDGPVEPAHRALPDANVTAHLLAEILKHCSIEDMIAWTAEPAVLPKISFGKHAGAGWPALPIDYLDWIVSTKNDLDQEVKWNAEREIRRRHHASREAYTLAAIDAVQFVGTRLELASWFTGAADTRLSLGIEKGSPEYQRIVAACTVRVGEIEGKKLETTP